VDISVTGGTAISNVDYIDTFPLTASWGEGESTTKTFNVGIVNRSGTQGSRTLTLQLNNNSGVAIGSTDTQTITITDVSSGTGIAEGTTNRFFSSQGNASWNGQYPVFRGGNNGPLPESSLNTYNTSGVRGVYVEKGLDLPFRFTNAHSGTSDSDFVTYSVYEMQSDVAIDIGSTVRKNDRVEFDQGVVEPERFWITGASDHPSTSRNWTISSRFTPACDFQDIEFARVYGWGCKNNEASGFYAGTQNTQANNLDRFNNPSRGVHFYNCSGRHQVGNGIRMRFATNFRLEGNYMHDCERSHYAEDQGPLTTHGSVYQIIGSSDGWVLFNVGDRNSGETFNGWSGSSDIHWEGNWTYGAEAVAMYINNHEMSVGNNVIIACPVSSASHLASTAPGAQGLQDTFDTTFETRLEFADISSWASVNDRPHNQVFYNNLLIGGEAMRQTAIQNIAGPIPDYSDIYYYNNFHFSSSGPALNRSTDPDITYVDNRYFNNVIFQAASDTSGSTSGLDARHQYWGGGQPGGNWNDSGDVTSGFQINFSGDPDNITMPSPTAQKDKEDVLALIDLADFRPTASSTTQGSGTPPGDLVIPPGITKITNTDLRRDFDGVIRGGAAVSMGPFE
jgi:hypothetical protein